LHEGSEETQRGMRTMSKKHRSVSDLIKSMDLPKEQKQEQIDYINSRRLSRLLAVMRTQKGMNQQKAAEKCGCTQSRISKLEYKEDRKVSIGELLDYSDALDMEMSVVFLPKKLRIVDHVKLHAAQIEHLLKRLVSLSQGDKAMAKAVGAFHSECLVNMLSIIGKSQKSMRPRKKHSLNVIGPQEVEQFIEEETVCV
jgi:predicted XRE-type DNA-binding protein